MAHRFGLQNGSKITDAGIYEQVIETNITKSREACSLKPEYYLFSLPRLSLLVCGCKEDVLTEGEKTAQQVQGIVSSRNIQVASAYSGGNRIVLDQPFSIDGEFLIFSGNTNPAIYLNLSKLSSFQVGQPSGSKPYIVFYF